MKVLVNYDKETPWTTGFYLAKAFEDLGHDLVEKGADLSVAVEPSAPIKGKFTVYWEIDSYRHGGDDPDKYAECDLVCFAANEKDKDKYGQWNTMFLPTAADPNIHKRHENVEESFDLVFVGSMREDDELPGYAERRRLLNLAEENGFSVLRAGGAYFDEYAKIMSQGKIIFNHSANNDINMRFWEGMSIGCAMYDDVVPSELAIPNYHYLRYKNDDEFLSLIKEHLSDDELRLQIRSNASDLINERHSYMDRAMEILSCVPEL